MTETAKTPLLVIEPEEGEAIRLYDEGGIQCDTTTDIWSQPTDEDTER